MLEDRGRGRKPRVCVDGRLLAAEATGVATYARTLVAALAATGEAPLILQDRDRGRFASPQGSATRVRRWLDARLPGPVRLREAQGALSARDVFRRAQARFNATGRLLDLAAPGSAGIMHWTWPVPARILGWTNLYTVHDVIPLTDPELGETDGAGLRARLDALLAGGARLATVSAFSRQEIATALGVALVDILDLGSALEPLVPDKADLPSGLHHDGFYLFCGTTEARKNLERIVAGWRASGTARPLVLAGHPARGDRGAGVIELGFVPRATLLALVAGARALVFPTLAEGFGLPVIEAMALGTPVITSDRGALAEVAGDAALLVDPFDPAAIGNAIQRIDGDQALRGSLRARGVERAHAFSLAAFGDRLSNAYREIAGISLDGP